MPVRVGLIVGREWSFPPAFIEEVNRRDEGVVAEFVTLGATSMEEPCPYAVIIDRISHEVPYYRTYLKHAVLQGVTVVNNPFMWSADDKLFGATLATKLGVASPKTVALPNREYVPGIVHDESLRNLVYPLDWQGIVEYVGMPCVLKDAYGGGWKDVYVCHSLDELLHNYNQSGRLTMIVQEFIQWEHFVRCIAIGQEDVLPIKYDPRERRYHVEHQHLTAELGKRVVEDTRKLCRALGYDMNSLEWAVRDGVPYAIDFMNPAPDMDINSLTPHYFEWVVKRMADMAIRLALNPQPQLQQLRWDGFFAGARGAQPRARRTSAEAASTKAASSKGTPAKAASTKGTPAKSASAKGASAKGGTAKPPSAASGATTGSAKTGSAKTGSAKSGKATPVQTGTGQAAPGNTNGGGPSPDAGGASTSGTT